jgi:tRNA pseudouridine38-40 synthase
MRNIKLTLEYDGTDFCGWQVQPEGRTVQGVLTENLTTLLREPVKIIAAGRTDAGVHARGQVVNFSTGSTISLQGLHRGLNALLPPDVVVRRVQVASSGFHARFDAVRRQYLYRIGVRSTALDRRYVWTVLRPLDLSVMQHAASILLGTHDFTAFCLSPGERKHCLCQVLEVSLKKARGEIHFRITANRFLHSMVRILVGQLVGVGCGRLSEVEFKQLLTGGKPHQPVAVAPPQGLCLMRIIY